MAFKFNFFLGASYQIFLTWSCRRLRLFVASARLSDSWNEAKITRARSGPTRFSHRVLQTVTGCGDHKSCRVYCGKSGYIWACSMYDPITQMTWLQTQKKESFAELSEFRCKMLVGRNAHLYTHYTLFYKDSILFLVCYSTLF